jgi:hypothetical protein
MSTSPPDVFLVTGRFRGPAGSGNGGYTSGLLAGQLTDGADPVTVTLRRPPPLDSALEVRLTAEDSIGCDGAELWQGDVQVASAARSAYRGSTQHPFPGCFVCGPERDPGDGMRLAPGMVDEGLTACLWLPDPSLVTGDDRSVVGREFAWAALDCPGGWTSDLEHRPMVLGRMTASCLSSPRVGRPHVVVGRLLGEEGRKTLTATSLYDDGRLVGRAEHTWIAVDPARFA